MTGFPDMEAVERDAERVWASDAAIRAEFGQQATYKAWRKAEATGRARVLGSPPSTAVLAQAGSSHRTDPEAVIAAARQEWQSDPSVRAEFGGNEATFLALRRGEAAGHVRIYGTAQRREQSVTAPVVAQATHSGQGATLQERQALVRQENVGRQFAGMPPLPIPQQ